MKFSLSVASLFFSTLVASKALSVFGGQKVFNEELKVPGENPLEYCQKDHSGDILTLKFVDLSPNPPTAGNILEITAEGILSEEVGEGAYVVLQVKYGLIRLVSTKADLCEQVANVDMKCPLEKGKTTITKSVELPKEIPPGKYTVFADVYTFDDKKVVCLQATVTFYVGGLEL